MQKKVLKVRYLESKKVLQNKCRLTRTGICHHKKFRLQITPGMKNKFYQRLAFYMINWLVM